MKFIMINTSKQVFKFWSKIFKEKTKLIKDYNNKNEIFILPDDREKLINSWENIKRKKSVYERNIKNKIQVLERKEAENIIDKY